MGFFSELGRRHVFRVAGGYLLLAWLVLQVTDVVISLLELPSGTGRLVFYILLIGFPLAILASWVFEITPEGIKRESQTDQTTIRETSKGRAIDFFIIAALTVVVGFLVWERIQPADVQDRSIAVLPVRSIDGDETSVLFARGMHDTLLAELAKVVNLDVIARRSVMEFAESNISVSEIAGLLGVTHVVDASVQKFGDQLRVSAQLIEAESDTHLWADTYDEAIRLDNFFNVQSQLVKMISTSLEASLLPTPDTAPDNDAAVRDYLAAVSNIYDPDSSNEDAKRLLESAVEKDPGFARAWVKLADLYREEYWWGGRKSDALNRAEEALTNARALKPDLPELHLVHAKIRYHGFLDFQGALDALARAEKTMPGSSEIYEWRGNVYRRMGALPEALSAHERAMALDPRSKSQMLEYGRTLLMARRFREAEKHYEQAVRQFPDSFWMRRGKSEIDWFRDGDASSVLAALKSSDFLNTSISVKKIFVRYAWYGGQLDLALEYLGRLEDVDGQSNDRAFRVEKVFILRDAGHEEASRVLLEQEAAALDELLTADPDDFSSLNFAARVAAALGKGALAEGYASRAVEVARNGEVDQDAFDMTNMQSIYGRTLCQVGDFDAAADVFRLVLQSTNSNTLNSLVAQWPPCRARFIGTEQYKALDREFGHLSEG